MGERFSRKVLSMIGFWYTKQRKLIAASMKKSYVARWRKAHCLRMTQMVRADKVFRPRVFLGASFINKNAFGKYTWSPIADAGGGVVDGINGGGVGGPYYTPWLTG